MTKRVTQNHELHDYLWY